MLDSMVPGVSFVCGPIMNGYLVHKHAVNIVCVCVVCAEIAEANPNKFRLDYGELESRKQFIRDTRAVIKVRVVTETCTQKV